ncbi:M48 family metallopeptidase [Patescibacteria group bacterium]|nr:M48 family metallopeptidase [Patescibacteria group bacterium]
MYSQIDSNKRKTAILMLIFVAVVLGIGYFLFYYYNAIEFLIIAVIISALMSLTSYFSGDKVALMSAGAKGPLEKSDNPYVYRVVENLCITAGLSMPKIYIIPESFPNAFATGRDPKHASIAITQGLIDRLENEELEGVIAHELAHIKNYDIRLMTVVIVLVGILALLSNMFLRFRLFGNGRRDSKSGGQGQSIIMIVGLVLLILSPIIAKIIQLAISRKREFLADAEGSLLTRYPEGLARALEKISEYKIPMKRASNATAHLYIVSPFGAKAKKGLAKMFSTHPPVEERIKVLRGM